jgi:hypothetical protein
LIELQGLGDFLGSEGTNIIPIQPMEKRADERRKDGIVYSILVMV